MFYLRIWARGERAAMLSSACLALLQASCTGAPRERKPVQWENVASSSSVLEFEEWKDAHRFPGKRDVYAVGEIVSPMGLVGDDDARRYYDLFVSPSQKLIIHNGQVTPSDPWVPSAFEPGSVLTYCIDRSALEQFDDRFPDLPPNSGTLLYNMLDRAFGEAAAAWNLVGNPPAANVPGHPSQSFSINRDATRDYSCDPMANDDITWYVKPYIFEESEPLEYLSFALQPHYNKANYDNREFLVLDLALVEFLDPGYIPNFPIRSWLTLEGLMLRTLGSALGFIGEENRVAVPGDEGNQYWPQSCWDSSVGGVLLSIADPFSVMTHPEAMRDFLGNPQCAGGRSFDYALTYVDGMGTACQYFIDNPLYYCNSLFQKNVRDIAGEHCSPAPMPPNWTGGTEECSGPVPYHDSAAQVHTAMLDLLLH